jgi:hypothetical protein
MNEDDCMNCCCLVKDENKTLICDETDEPISLIPKCDEWKSEKYVSKEKY